MNVKLLFNPFERIAGWGALVAGFAAMAATAFLASRTGIAFDGVLDVHMTKNTSYTHALAHQGLAFLSTFLCMWLAAAIFSKSRFRIIDIAGTMAFARVPLLAVGALALLPIVPANLFDIGKLILFVLVCILGAAWMIRLMWKGYSISCNIGGARGAWSFVGALLTSEAISKVAIIFLLSSSAPVIAAEIPATQTPQQTADKIITAFAAKDYDGVRSYFDETMLKKAPTDAVATIWEGLEGKFGPFVSANPYVKTETTEGYRILKVPCKFRDGDIRLQMAFDSRGKLAGLYILGRE